MFLNKEKVDIIILENIKEINLRFLDILKEYDKKICVKCNLNLEELYFYRGNICRSCENNKRISLLEHKHYSILEYDILNKNCKQCKDCLVVYPEEYYRKNGYKCKFCIDNKLNLVLLNYEKQIEHINIDMINLITNIDLKELNLKFLSILENSMKKCNKCLLELSSYYFSNGRNSCKACKKNKNTNTISNDITIDDKEYRQCMCCLYLYDISDFSTKRKCKYCFNNISITDEIVEDYNKYDEMITLEKINEIPLQNIKNLNLEIFNIIDDDKKICRDCNNKLSVYYFEGNRNTCKYCRYRDKYTTKKYFITKELKTNHNQCKTCLLFFNIDCFYDKFDCVYCKFNKKWIIEIPLIKNQSKIDNVLNIDDINKISDTRIKEFNLIFLEYMSNIEKKVCILCNSYIQCNYFIKNSDICQLCFNDNNDKYVLNDKILVNDIIYKQCHKCFYVFTEDYFVNAINKCSYCCNGNLYFKENIEKHTDKMISFEKVDKIIIPELKELNLKFIDYLNDCDKIRCVKCNENIPNVYFMKNTRVCKLCTKQCSVNLYCISENIKLMGENCRQCIGCGFLFYDIYYEKDNLNSKCGFCTYRINKNLIKPIELSKIDNMITLEKVNDIPIPEIKELNMKFLDVLSKGQVKKCYGCGYNLYIGYFPKYRLLRCSLCSNKDLYENHTLSSKIEINNNYYRQCKKCCFVFISDYFEKSIIVCKYCTSTNCIEDFCDTFACFNHKDKKIGIYCFKHKKNGMINVLDRCIENECNTRANFNYKGLKKRLYCKKHSKVNMVNISNPNLCIMEELQLKLLKSIKLMVTVSTHLNSLITI